MADAGFNVYSMDLPGHGDSTVGFDCHRGSPGRELALDVLGPNTIAVGHSLGGALLLDLANDRPFGKLLLLSPAPTSIDRIRADRVLVLIGQFDLHAFGYSFLSWRQPFPAVSNCEQFRGLDIRDMCFSPKPIREIVVWLGGNPSALRTRHRLDLLFLEILSGIAIPALWLKGKPILQSRLTFRPRTFSYIASCAVAFLISGFVVVMKGLRLFSTDYLISFVFLVESHNSHGPFERSQSDIRK